MTFLVVFDELGLARRQTNVLIRISGDDVSQRKRGAQSATVPHLGSERYLDSVTSDLKQLLAAAIDDVNVDRVVSEIAGKLDMDAAEAHQQLAIYLNESWVALELIEPHLQTGQRILEVGSGIGFFAGFLHGLGYDVVEVEPIGTGFQFIGAARSALKHESGPRHLDIGVEELTPEDHGRFDLIYSLNVLEHVPDWQEALTAATSVLATDGVMCQSCANYSFPYEPHFGIPLVPIWPAATAHILPKRITTSEVWQSLNWVTLRGVRSWAETAGATVDFESGRLADALERLSTDAEFASRHGRLLTIGARIAQRVKLLAVVRKMPASWTSPMIFAVRRPQPS